MTQTKIKRTLTGRRAAERDLIAWGVKSRGKRREIMRQWDADRRARRDAKREPFTPDTKRRTPVRVKVRRARRFFAPGSVGHTNAMIVGALRVAREIDSMGARAACSIGYGDKKRRRKLRAGLADTTTLTRSWRYYWQRYGNDEARIRNADEAADAARRESKNPLKRGFQWFKDKVLRGQR